MCWKVLLDLVAKQGSLFFTQMCVTDYYEIILNKTKKLKSNNLENYRLNLALCFSVRISSSQSIILT